MTDFFGNEVDLNELVSEIDDGFELNRIYCENNLETMARMPDNFLDLTVTSPPYNKKKVSGKLVKEVIYDSYDDSMDEVEYQNSQIAVLDELYRVTNENGACFYNHKIRYNKVAIHPMEWILRTKWNLHQEIIWNRKITGNIRGWRCYNIDERIYWLVKKPPKEIEQRLAQYSSVWDVCPERNINGHPAPFPEEIANRCIKIGSSAGGLVYDPFMGSGTTAKMALLNGRKFIGSEISQEYCEIAKQRIAEVR